MQPERGQLDTDPSLESIVLFPVVMLTVATMLVVVSHHPVLLLGVVVGASIRPLTRMARRLAQLLATQTRSALMNLQLLTESTPREVAHLE